MREKHLRAIANILKDFRKGEIVPPTPEHVDRWVRQFDACVQVPILRELHYVLKQTYFSKERVSEFFKRIFNSREIAGEDVCDFWQSANILNIQQNGTSQQEIRNLFGSILLEKCDLDIDSCGTDDGPYIYLDDVLFTGNRIISDLKNWIPSAPDNATVYIIVIAKHLLGEYWCKRNLNQVAADNNKNISFKFYEDVELENRLSNKDYSDVLWPTAHPEDDLASEYLSGCLASGFEARQAGVHKSFFSSEEGRQLLETQFLLAGIKIINFCQMPNSKMKPLGYSQFNPGFGSTIVTYRNCPNNCPLALWWGDPDSHISHPFSKWYPLVQRKTYSQEE